MNEFPRTQIEGLSVSRLIAGTNWFLGYSHQSKARNDMIKQRMGRAEIADVLEVFLSEGIDTMLGPRPLPHLVEAIRDAEDRVGRRIIQIGTPHLKLDGSDEAMDQNRRTLDEFAEIGIDVCMPHQATTDALVCRRTKAIPGMDAFCAMIRERGMIPGLSTHMPETPLYADRTDLDVGTYIQIYNAAGFLMQIEVDWVHRMIWNAKKPVLTIKPLAAGRLPPLVGLAFNWATIRPIDMVAIGTFSPDEAREVIELSRSILDNRANTLELQATRSKASLQV
jgi:hypothetical protein